MTNKTESSSSEGPTPGIRTYQGACVCGAVRFEADLDLSAGTIRCNCTLCAKTGLWSAHVKPEHFRLLAGEESLIDFQRNGRFAHFLFCKHCGARPFSRGDAPWMGGAYVAVNVPCLEDADLGGLLVRHFDGRHDRWDNPRIERLPPSGPPTA
jgi:hypothetical protein